MRISKKEEVLRYLRLRDFAKLKDALSSWLVPDIAELMGGLHDSDSVLLFRTLHMNQQAETFSYLEPDEQEKLLGKFTNKEAEVILANMSPDDRTALFEELPGIITSRLFELLSLEDLKETRLLLGYPEHSVGRMMTPNYVAVCKDMDVRSTLEFIRKKGHDSETLHKIYVIDSEKKLLDSIPLRRIVLAEPDRKIADLMSDTVVSLSAYDDREKAVKLMRKYDFVALPVVGSDGVMIGIVTVDDVFDVAEKEATEDIHKIGSVSPLRTSYTNASLFTLYHRRIFWLSLLVFVSLFSSGVLAFFEETLSSAIVLAFFIPLLIGSGGNIGSQSATLMIRALATEDVRLNEWFRVLMKEIVMGILLGLSLGIFASFIGYFRGGYTIGLIVGLTMLAIILLANLIGALLPFILSRLNIDPAVASSPMITTIVDALGLFVYFSIAVVFI